MPLFRQVSHITDLYAENEILKNKLNDQITSIQTLQQTQASMTSQLTNGQHIESGTLHCGGSKHWTGRIDRGAHVGHRYNDVTHKFSTPYTRPPHLQYGVVNLYFWESRKGDKKYVIYWVDEVSLTAEGFTLRCRIEDLATFYGRLTIRWTVFPK